jgi:hypothetical protein
MKKWNILLSILLLFQAGLVILSATITTDIKAITIDQPLLNFRTEHIDTVLIQGPDSKQVRLARSDGSWRLPEYYSAPADQDQVKQLLEKLHALKRDWPVATTKGAEKRFKVAPDAFERHILLRNGEHLEAELYVGTSPSFRKVHVRLPDSSEIMAVSFAAFDAETNAEKWLDKQLLKINASEIKELHIGELTLVKKDEGMVPITENPDTPVDRKKVEQLVNRIADMQISSIAGTEVRSAYGLDTPALTCTITLNNGKTTTWKFGKKKDEESYVLQASNQDFLFNIPAWKIKPLLKVKPEDLLSDAPNTRDSGDKPAGSDDM